MTLGFVYGSTAPTAVSSVAYLPESDSTGTITSLKRYMSATGRYTFSVEVPDRAGYVVLTFANTGGTPTGTIVINGYMNQYN
jgi:hypothetical protein